MNSIAKPYDSTPRDYKFHTPFLQRVFDSLRRISDFRYMWVVFLGLGLIRNLAVLFAYPPAHGSDSFVYFLYVERLKGYDIPLISQSAPPLYPILLYVSVHVLKSVYWLIGVQFIASAAIAPLFYQALKRYNALLAFGVALIILGDMQLAVPFNFTATEPLYITVMTLALVMFLYATDAPERTRKIIGLAFAVGVLLALLLLTRAVARYFIIAFALVMLLRTFDLKRTAALFAGFVFTMAVWLGISTLAWGNPEGSSTSNYMMIRVVVEKSEWVSSDNGPYSAQYVPLREICPQIKSSEVLFCMYEELGDWDETAELVSGVYTETVRANWQDYIKEIWGFAGDFLSMNAKQYGFDEGVPSNAQCDFVDERIEEITPETLRETWWTWILPDYPDYSEQTVQDMRTIQRRVLTYMCPPIPNSLRLKSGVDFIASRYRSLGRPNPFNWYVAALVFALVIPWARRYMTPVLIFGGVLAMHALMSAVTFNVQPRYVMVTNPLRATLLLFVVYVAGMLALHAFDAVIFRMTRPAANRD